MITKEQYVEILDVVESYLRKHDEVFPDKPLSMEYQQGIIQVIDLIKTLVKK